MSPDIPVHIIEVIHNGVPIKVEVRCTTCVYESLGDDQEPCKTCDSNNTIGNPFSLWHFNPNFDSEAGESSPASSGMLPRQQKIGYISVLDAIHILKVCPQKDNVTSWNMLILKFVLELQKLQEDELIPAPVPDKNLSNWLIDLQQYCRERELQKDLQFVQQKQDKCSKENGLLDQLFLSPNDVEPVPPMFSSAHVERLDQINHKIMKIIANYNLRNITESQFNKQADQLEAALQEIVRTVPGTKIEIDWENHQPVKINGKSVQAIIASQNQISCSGSVKSSSVDTVNTSNSSTTTSQSRRGR